MNRPLFYIVWIIGAVLLLFYSFTQIDLSLTLNKVPVWITIQQYYKQIGWFDRATSFVLFSRIMIFLGGLYVWSLYIVKKGLVTRRDVWIVIFIISGILFFSYNAFSYDFFNYIFDAKILSVYHQNPYQHKALDFPGDPMLTFMRWTHRTYPYGPSWLVLTVPLTIGIKYFLVTYFLFKLLMVGAFLGTCYFIEKILLLTKNKYSVFNLTLFALNPLIVIESIVSAHNDIVMIVFAMISLYLLLKEKFIFSFLLLIFSIGIKFGTAVLLPIWLLYFIYRKKSLFNKHSLLFLLLSLLMVVPVVLATIRTNYQPWYLIGFFAFVSLVRYRIFVATSLFCLSLFSLAIYGPYIAEGSWNNALLPQLYLLNFSTLGFVSEALLLIIIFEFYYKN